VGQEGHSKSGVIIFSMEKGTRIINWEQDCFTPQINISS
jgi:hypothetical protein